MGRLKSRFVRAVIETVQQQSAGGALNRLRSGLPAYLLRLLSRDVLGQLERDASIELEAGLELLLAVDRVMCGGSGIVTTRATSALASRVLSQSSGLTVPGDALATLQHLRAPFEQPFVDVDLHFHARRTPDQGFLLELRLPGPPRGTSWLCSAGLGYAEAAATFSGKGAARLRFTTEITADVARIVGRQLTSGVMALPSAQLPATAERQRPSPARRRQSATNAVREVDQILNRLPGAGAQPFPAPLAARPRSASSAPPPGPRPASVSGVRPTAAGSAPPRSRKSAG